MSELAALLRERIGATGPITFAEFQNLALYHAQFGYYSAGLQRTGWRGHFVTSAEIAPVFGRLWARAFESMWTDLGRPAQFDLVEVGPGEGGFVEAVLGACAGRFADALSYRLVERSPPLVERQMERLSSFDNVSWVASLEEVGSATGCLFANEVLDNLAVHVVERTGAGWVELLVGLRGDRLALEAGPLSDPALERYLEDTGLQPPKGHRVEVGLEAVELARQCARTVTRGAVVFVDYAIDASSITKRPAGTLLAYSATGADEDLLDRPGHKDLTSHVNWTAVATALVDSGMTVSGPRSQRDVLAALGAAEMDEFLKEAHRAALAGGRGVDALRALSQRQALGVLRDPSGLGGLQVLAGLRGVAAPWELAT